MRKMIRERFWEKVEKTTDCWNWTAAKNANGYGIFDGRVASRKSYEDTYGRVEVGLHLDHLCRNRACVRPSHLEAVTPRKNVLRGIGPSAENAVKTKCKYGHPFNTENTYVYRVGSSQKRYCRTCRKRLWKERGERRKHTKTQKVSN